MPALAALIVMGLLLKERGHRAAPYLLWAAAVFAVSVTFRSLDMALCSDTVFDGRKIGTHFLWHLLNALTLFLLLRASLEAGAPAAHQALPAVPAEVGQVPAIEEEPTNAEAVEQEELAPSPEVAAKEEPPAREPAVEDEPRPTHSILPQTLRKTTHRKPSPSRRRRTKSRSRRRSSPLKELVSLPGSTGQSRSPPAAPLTGLAGYWITRFRG